MKKILAILTMCFIFYHCSETDILNETGKMEITDFNLPQLPDNYYYEGWLMVDGSYVSVGRITNDSIINNRARFEEIEVNDLNTAQSFAITVESSGSPAPSNYVLLVGNFNGNTAELSPDAEVPNGVMSLANRISASYTIQNATIPTEENGNYGTVGLWFFKGEEGNRETTLQLDYTDLNYQGWVKKSFENNEWALNMGVITSDTIADNYKSFTIFPNNTPDFAGDDFLQDPEGGIDYPEGFFPMDVRGSKLVITPIPTGYNNSEVPFPIDLLQATVPADASKDPNLTRALEINTDFGAKAIKL